MALRYAASCPCLYFCSELLRRKLKMFARDCQPATLTPTCSMNCGRVYTDGSSRDNESQLNARNSFHPQYLTDGTVPRNDSTMLALTTQGQATCGDNRLRLNGVVPTVATAIPCVQQAGGHRPWIDPTDYGASGRPRVTETDFGSVISGSSVLRVPRADGFVIGGGVYLAGAGRSGADYLGTVTGTRETF